MLISVWFSTMEDLRSVSERSSVILKSTHGCTDLKLKNCNRRDSSGERNFYFQTNSYLCNIDYSVKYLHFKIFRFLLGEGIFFFCLHFNYPA